MRMFDSYEHQPASSASSSCDMESMDEIAPPSASSILSLNEDLAMSTHLSTTVPQSSVTLRFKVSPFMSSSMIKINLLRSFSLSLSLLKKKRKRKLESDTVSLRSLEDLVGDHFQRKKRLSLPRLSSVSELLSPMCDRVINMLHTTKQSSSANLLNLINHSSNGTANMRRKPSSQQASHGSMSSPNTVKKFRAAWSETCDGEKLKQTMTATEIERQNVLYELFSEEQQMIENLGLAQRVSVRRLPLQWSSVSTFV